jgi:glutamine synthetase
MNKEQLITAAGAAEVRLVRFLYCDNGGVIRGKLAHIDHLAKRLDTGIGLTVAMQAFNMLDELHPFEGMGPVGEIRLVPDPDNFVVLPYAPNAAAMMCDMLTLERAPWAACPRSFLKRMIARAADRGMTVQATFENEFSLLRPDGDGGHAPIDTGGCFSTVSMTAAAEVIHPNRRLLPRARPRPTRAAHPPRPGAARRRQPDLAARDRARGRPPARPGGLAGAQAAAGAGRQQRPHPLERVGRGRRDQSFL